MKIKVFSEEAIQTFKTDEKHIVISIQDPRYNFVVLPANTNRLDWVGFWLYDFDEKTGREQYDKFLFNNAQARAIINFVNKWKDEVDLICVNCVAGISRSAGVASAISKILNEDDSYFFKHYLPNMLVYRTILKEYYEEK